MMKSNNLIFVNQIHINIFLLLFVFLPTIKHTLAQDFTVPGKISVPYPTIKNLAVEWYIQGDDNLNGTVTVLFREKGKRKWKEGMPLRRIPAGKNLRFEWVNKHSGSIFDLNPNTEYEIKLSLFDPDGGQAVQTVSTYTRAEPKISSQAKLIELEPGTNDTLFTENGTKAHPVVYICRSGECIYRYVDLKNKQWVYIVGLTINNDDRKGCAVSLDGAENCVIQNCEINSVYGIVAYPEGATNCYIGDNIITGICKWLPEAMGSNGDNIGEGVQMTGSGNVICYNRVTGFRDCISTMEDHHVSTQTCIDIYNNDIYNGVDDAIEADFCFSNCRIMRNRITNCYIGLSSQPGLGGPTYFIRNAMYNLINGGLKLQRNSKGDVILHNTMIKIGRGFGGNTPMDFAYFRNNLAIGGPVPEVEYGKWGVGNPYAADIKDPGEHSSFDYDAVGVVGTTYIAKIGNKSFSEVEKHGIENIGIDVFSNLEFPNPPVPERNVPDLRPVQGSRVVDAAVRIPNINDDYLGNGPDCGAYESGQKLPHYGPRTKIGL